MINENSFFKKIPQAIDLEQRLVWEAAGWAIQMMGLSYDRLKTAASNIDVASTDYPTSLATEMFACCWSIIDQCHMLRKLLERVFVLPDGEVAQFIKKFETVTFIRNVMDHLPQNINNVANKKQPIPPIFGALSFCSVADDDVSSIDNKGAPAIKGCSVVTLTAGALTHPKHNFQVVSPTGRIIELPVGGFQFMAFEYRVDLSDLMADLASLVAHFDNVVKPEQERQLRNFAQENNLDEDKVVNEHSGAFCVILRLDFPLTTAISEPPKES
jgi:hypothetical protein